MKKKSAEDYLDKLLNSVNDEKVKKEQFRETAKMLEDAMNFWEESDDADDSEYEDAEYKAHEEKVQKKSGSEDFLDSLLSGAKNTEFGMNQRKPEVNPMYSRRVSRSEADFLKEFEAELEGEADELADLFAEITKDIQPKDKLSNEDIASPEEPEDFTFGEINLTSLVDEAANVISGTASVEDDIPIDDSSMLDMLMAEEATVLPNAEDVPIDVAAVETISSDVFADLFGQGEDLNLADMIPSDEASGQIDLSNLGEEDLMSLLAGADELSDIGNMLSNAEITEIPLDEMDAFAVFAESEMSAQAVSAEPVEEEIVASPKNKGGLVGKIKNILKNLLADDEDDEVSLTASKKPTAESLSNENAEILAELDEQENKKAKKEKKKKEKKPKKEKPAKKPKAPKAPKPKKEKKPKEVDNTPPLPKGPVFMIWLMAASLVALVLLGVNTIKYNTPITNAKNLYNQGHYAEGFSKLNGLEIKEKDQELYNKLAILSTVDSELNAYERFTAAEKADWAFDSLICAAGRCEINEADADVFGCLGQLETLKRTVSNELSEKYGMTYEEAIEMYTIRDRDDYTIALYKKLTELGIDWE